MGLSILKRVFKEILTGLWSEERWAKETGFVKLWNCSAINMSGILGLEWECLG